MNKVAFGVLGVALLGIYNAAQPDLVKMRTRGHNQADALRREAIKLRSQPTELVEKSQARILQIDKQAREVEKQSYGPSLAWLDRLANAKADQNRVKLDLNVLSSMMVAGLAANMKSQVANLLWMKADEYWHNGMLTRQVPLMEAVVTLDPQFIDAWSTAGWHWAYNIYADIEADPRFKKLPLQEQQNRIRDGQLRAVTVGLDYLNRGSNLNPDTYRLWFENAYTREHKAGYNDEETARLYRIARQQPDARNIIRDFRQNGTTKQVVERGMDLVGRQIGHLYEERPDFDRALNQYGGDLLRATPQERELLNACGEYWGRYSSDYATIVSVYEGGDATVKAQVRKLVPDVERIVAAHKMRDRAQVRENGNGSQPTGAYISIVARYVPAWTLMKQGKLTQARDTIIGVMNANPKYHLQGLPVLAKVMELRGDAPQTIAQRMEELRKMERESTQGIGLKVLAAVYGKMEAQATNATAKKAFGKLAYETWYRARVRDSLDFYAKHQTRVYQARYGFKDVDENIQKIVKEVKESRKGGIPNAAPDAPPSAAPGGGGVPHDHDGDGKSDHASHDEGGHEGHDHADGDHAGHDHGERNEGDRASDVLESIKP